VNPTSNVLESRADLLLIGPFDATNMQSWFAASYFVDTLPVRREHESSYRTLAVLKEETGTATEPFVTRAVPKYPTNPPVSTSSAQEVGDQRTHEANLFDSLNNLSLNTASPPRSGHQTPLRSESVFATQSPAFAQSTINRSLDPFGHTASYQSSPVVQHGRPAWENAIASPAISRAAFGGHVQHEVPQLHQQPSYGGFPQAQYGQNRSIFESPQVQSPFAQIPPPVHSPWGAPQPAGPAQMMPAQSFVASPFQQPMQSPYQPMASMQPWHGTPTPQSAVVQQQQQIQNPGFATMSTSQESQMPIEQSSIVDSVLSPIQAEAVVQPTPQVNVSDFSDNTAQPQVANDASHAVDKSDVISPAEPEPEAQAEVLAPVAIAAPIEIPAVKETAKVKTKGKKAARMAAAAERAAEMETSFTVDAQSASADNDAASPSAGTPSVAPWANKEEEKVKVSSGPTLREIQEAEAKAAESRKQEAKAKAAVVKASTVSASADAEPAQTVSWGLPSRTGGTANVPTPSASPAPVWGSSDAAPKKTLKQIQEEEQRRTKAAAQAKAAASPAAASQQGKRGYADLAAAQSVSTVSIFQHLLETRLTLPSHRLLAAHGAQSVQAARLLRL
jgi:PERQ amino acid-rich with GYF domain-containing protein